MTSSAGRICEYHSAYLRAILICSFSAVCLDSAVARPDFPVRDAAVEAHLSFSCQREAHAKESSQHGNGIVAP